MTKLFTFMKESDSEAIRHSHRRRAKEIAISMSKKTSESNNAPTDTTMSGQSTYSGIEDNRPGWPDGLIIAHGFPRLVMECFRRPSHGR